MSTREGSQVRVHAVLLLQHMDGAATLSQPLEQATAVSETLSERAHNRCRKLLVVTHYDHQLCSEPEAWPSHARQRHHTCTTGRSTHRNGNTVLGSVACAASSTTTTENWRPLSNIS